jgi:hypothetical protein
LTTPGGALNKAAGQTQCLAVVQLHPATEVGLRGFNFTSTNMTVKLSKVDGTFKDIVRPVTDFQGDTTSAPDIASCSVRDHAYFLLPGTVPDGLNDIPVPPGRYSLTLTVPNDSNFAPDTGPAPAEFTSNAILVDILPRTDLHYSIQTNFAFCVSETSPSWAGSDEPWFRAMALAAGIPEAQSDFSQSWGNPVDIMDTDDVDSGEFISIPAATLFDGVVDQKILAIGMIGLEVDSDDAAKEDMHNFFDCYVLYMKQFLVFTASSVDGGFLGTELSAFIKTGSTSLLLYVTGGVMAAILGAGVLFALWAPADLLAYDFLVNTSLSLFALTDGDKGNVPPNDSYEIDSVKVSTQTIAKDLVDQFSSKYTEQRTYENPGTEYVDRGEDYHERQYQFKTLKDRPDCPVRFGSYKDAET